MKTKTITYDFAGNTMVGFYAAPEGAGRRPALLVSHEAWGLSDHARDSARRLAELGYAAFALDYHGGGHVYSDPDTLMPKIGAMMADPSKIRAVGKAGLATLLAQPEADPAKAAAIGYCFGGTLSFELAREGVPLKAAVGFHSGLATAAPAKKGAVTAKLLALIGADDPLIPAEQRTAFESEMSDAGADWQLVVYGGAAHSFTNPAAKGEMPGIIYDERTDKRSWQAMMGLFAEVF